MDAPTPRTALVTGAARRIGRVVALGLAKDGFAVAVHFNRSEKKARDVVETIVDGGGKAALVRADLGREEQVKGLIGEANGRLGALGLLVNNASVFEDDRADTATRESWDMHMEINLRAPFVLMQAFAAQAGATPLGRNVEAEEILGAVRFILATPSMTGQMIALDGGQHLGWAANRQPAQE